ncbi:MAG: hypothetical protein NVS3B18_08480 [Candidatus Dormibacteria bacterium]
MTTINADDVRIPRKAREALARHEEVMVLNRDRPVYVLSNPEDRRSASKSMVKGRPLRESIAILTASPLPDDRFGADLEAIRDSIGPMPADPWVHS